MTTAHTTALAGATAGDNSMTPPYHPCRRMSIRSLEWHLGVLIDRLNHGRLRPGETQVLLEATGDILLDSLAKGKI